MADDLDSFYAEIASIEADVAQETEKQAPPPALPPPSSNENQQLPRLPPPPRPPPSAPISLPPAVISQAPVISAPPRPSQPTPPQPPPPPQAPQPSTTAIPQPFPPRPPPPPQGKKIGFVRQAAGQRWIDPTLAEWPENDFRIFVGNLGTEVTDAMLTAAFNKYDTFQKAKVVRDGRTTKSKGYGFVSLGDSKDGVRALREMNAVYIGQRPCQLRKCKLEERSVLDKKGRPKKRVIDTRPPPPPPKDDFYDKRGGNDRDEDSRHSKQPKLKHGSVLHN